MTQKTPRHEQRTTRTKTSRLPAVAGSVALHLLFAAGVLVLPGRLLEPDEPRPIDIVFYPVEREIAPPEPAPEPEPEPIEVVSEPLEIVEARPERLAEPVSEPPRRIAKWEPAPAEPVVVEPSKPRPVVRTNLLAESRPEPKRRAPARSVQAAQFATMEAVATRPAPAARRVVSEASFGGGSIRLPREPARRESAVVTASFATTTAPNAFPRTASRDRGAVTAVAFGSGVVEPTEARPAVGTVVRGGLGDGVRETPRSARRELPSDDLDSVVEIISKPRPVYTEEARSLRIEGEVVLEVLFVHSGELRVLRVLGGLGHGLDGAAVEAAEKIRFKPARRNGQPVDHTATLRVLFRLA